MLSTVLWVLSDAPGAGRQPLLEAWTPTGGVIGKGTFGFVEEVKHGNTGYIAVRKSALQSAGSTPLARLKLLLREAYVLKKCQHPNIVRLYSAHITTVEKDSYLVIEKADCDLLDFIHRPLADEQTLLRLVGDVLRAVSHMHDEGVAHLDIKLENILVFNASDGATLKLCDMGCSARVGDRRLRWGAFGSKPYMAPETESYPSAPPQKDDLLKAVDAWACGIVIFACAFGVFPFEHALGSELFAVFKEVGFADYCARAVPLASGMSDGFMACLEGLMRVDPAARLSCRGALQCLSR